MVLSGWPRVSETFALNELLALEEAGMLGLVVATKAGDDALVQPGCARLRTPVQVLAAGDAAAQAAELVALAAGTAIDGVHGYFAHRPADVAERAARALGVRHGFSSHALDVRKVTRDELAARAASAAVVVACNQDVAASLAEAGADVHLLPHGVDATTFTPAAGGAATAAADAPLELVAVGRLVAKKGFDVLLAALAEVRRPYRLRIVGDGPERAALEKAAADHGVLGAVTFAGRCTHAELPGLLRSADVVVAPSVVDANGDRDGLPNVVLEAMACGRAVVASDVAAIATAVRPGHTGVLVPPRRPDALAAAIDALAASPAERDRLGRNARACVEDEFELSRCTARFVHALEVAYG